MRRMSGRLPKRRAWILGLAMLRPRVLCPGVRPRRDDCAVKWLSREYGQDRVHESQHGH